MRTWWHSQGGVCHDEAGLQRALHKSFIQFKAWDAEVDGIAGKVGAR